MAVDLREAWADLLRRRAALAPSLRVHAEIFERWAATTARVAPLAWSAAECRARWGRGVPLLAEADPALGVDDTEELLAAALETVGGLRGDLAPAIQRFARAWDRGEITPRALFPAKGRVGAVPAEIGLPDDVVAFAALATLRPLLEPYFAPCREHLPEDDWSLGVCPYCGAPGGYGDVVEDGRRQLACHVCGGGWYFSRMQCPYCGNADSKELVRLEPGAAEEGYSVAACLRCRAYLKELDRRVRWNGGPALVEDWGSPHFDLVATRSGYRRPLPSLLQLVKHDQD